MCAQHRQPQHGCGYFKGAMSSSCGDPDLSLLAAKAVKVLQGLATLQAVSGLAELETDVQSIAQH